MSPGYASRPGGLLKRRDSSRYAIAWLVRSSYTINTYFNRPNVGTNYHYLEKRLITPREGLRLQSFPDCFTPCFKSQRSLYKQIGNAVPPLMSFSIAKTIKRLFEDESS